ncbi:aminotransferase class IV family protein [Streptomyces sp. NPDC052396]|uniref:aminotransferase class IV family protein n=1 Tax=Streptomyces sp. NPDC052396 TaxID=3365689 RepID=UPI0037D941F8
MELNGRSADPEALKALALTNYGHFTTLRVEDGRVRGLALHLERLARDCRAVFGAELDLDRVRACLARAAGGGGSIAVRVTVFDPGLDLGHPAGPADPHILVTTRPAGTLPLPPLRVKTVSYVRDAPAVKHTGLFGTLHARRAAQLAGFDDALFTGPGGLVTEGGTWNVGFVDADGAVVWPEAEVLPGVTMALLRRHHPCVEAPLEVSDLGTMRAAFATNAAIGVRAIAGVDELGFATDDVVLEQLSAAYAAVPGEALANL